MVSDSVGGRMGLIELLLNTHCAASVGGSGLVFRVIAWDHQSQYISHSLTFSGKHNVTCMIRGMGSITTLSQQKLITQAGFFYFALILFLLLKFATHSILFIGPPSTGTLLLYRSCCASCFILTQWNYEFLNLFWKWSLVVEFQRKRGEIKFRFGHWALLLFSGWKSPRRNKKITVTSGLGKWVLT